MVNSKPKFSDIEEKNFGLDPQKLNNSITKTTKAVIPIHYGGLACKIDEISEICKKKKILLVEDCAEALGAKFKGKHVGNFGEMVVFEIISISKQMNTPITFLLDIIGACRV